MFQVTLSRYTKLQCRFVKFLIQVGDMAPLNNVEFFVQENEERRKAQARIERKEKERTHGSREEGG